MQKLLLYLFLITNTLAYTQIKFEQEIDKLIPTHPQLNDTIQIDISGLNLYEILTSIADEHRININVDPQLNFAVISSFYDITVKDVFVFLVNKYDLDASFVKNIIVFKKKALVKATPIIRKRKIIDVSYKVKNKFLSVNLRNDSIGLVAQKITDLTNQNIIIAPELKGTKVSSYIKNRPFDQVLNMLAKSNGLKVDKDENDFYYFSKAKIIREQSSSKSKDSNKKKLLKTNHLELTSDGFLNIKVDNASVYEIMIEAAEKLNITYFIYDTPDRLKTTLHATSITFEDLLEHVFESSDYTFVQTDDYFIIGKHNTKGLRTTEVIQLEYRTIESVKQSIPQALTRDLSIEDFIELNSLIVSGSKFKIDELKNYIKQIDKVVPLIQIEVLIVNYQKGYDISTGIQAGLQDSSQETSETTGTILNNINLNLNSSSINNLIDSFNGMGAFNIGKVNKNFYLNLQALENNSIIDVHSTPKIATLNGHEASLSIGETSYYFEQNNRLLTSGIGNDVLQSGTWKSTDASLSVKIKPFVSKDEHVTLTIVVEQSSFLPRAGAEAPPGKTTQKFDAMIRVKNSEMVLLGGLEELEKGDSTSSVPLLARIPIIKWLFSSKTKSNKKSKLHVFIKPTIVY